MISPRNIQPGSPPDAGGKVPISLETRERAFALATAARARFNAAVGQVNQRYAELKRQRIERHHGRWDALRAEREVLLHAQPRDYQALAAVEQQMRDHKAAPLPSVAMEEEQRQGEIRELDRTLAVELQELRDARDRGELAPEQAGEVV